MRTIRGFASNPDHEEIKNNAELCIKKYINKVVNLNAINQEIFDKMHRDACNNLIWCFEGQNFTIGQAQKWINMTFKYLFLLGYEKINIIYEYCHVPIDNYMLKITNYHISISWSKLTNYDEYFEYQEWFRNKYRESIPLDVEFYLWIEEARKRTI